MLKRLNRDITMFTNQQTNSSLVESSQCYLYAIVEESDGETVLLGSTTMASAATVENGLHGRDDDQWYGIDHLCPKGSIFNCKDGSLNGFLHSVVRLSDGSIISERASVTDDDFTEVSIIIG